VLEPSNASNASLPARPHPPQVFAPTAGQESVFEEISELVQSALDGHKVTRVTGWLGWLCMDGCLSLAQLLSLIFAWPSARSPTHSNPLPTIPTNPNRPHPHPIQQVCIFAYGQTGSGKTYTMLGSEDNRGIIPRAISQIFTSSKQLGTQGWTFNMQVLALCALCACGWGGWG